MGSSLEPLVLRLEAAIARLEAAGVLQPGAGAHGAFVSRDFGAVEAVSPSVSAFEEVLSVHVAKVVELGSKIGGQAAEASGLLKAAFEAEKEVVIAISKCKKPDLAELQKLVKPVGDALEKGSKLTEGRRTDHYNHVKVVAESLNALTWVVYVGKDSGMSLPGAHVEEMWSSAAFYANKVLVDNKNKEGGEVHVAWAKAMKELFLSEDSGLKSYVKKFHLTGPSWNPSGVDPKTYSPSSPSPSTATPRSAPPPPPPGGPPPPPPPSAFSASAASSGPDMSKIFSALNQGDNVTSGLRKVTADMKTKNRPASERSSVVPATAQSSSPAAAAPAAAAVSSKKTTLPPVFELQQGRKWVVEYQVDRKDIEISNTEPKQSVYIFGCKGSVIQIKGKVNNITLDKCTKTGVVFEDVVAACEVVNCNAIEVQCQGSAPSIAVDNTSGCQLYLSSTAIAAGITTAKSSEVNVLVPGATEDSDWVEHALPEQFLSVFNPPLGGGGGHFVTTAVTHSG